jgi:hypothetical protein
VNYECVTCGALVPEASEDKHERWHRDLDASVDQALRIVGILTHRAGGEVTLSETELIGADCRVATSLDVVNGAMTIRVSK